MYICNKICRTEVKSQHREWNFFFFKIFEEGSSRSSREKRYQETEWEKLRTGENPYKDLERIRYSKKESKMGRNSMKEGYINPEKEVERSIQETANWGAGGRSSKTQPASQLAIHQLTRESKSEGWHRPKETEWSPETER